MSIFSLSLLNSSVSAKSRKYVVLGGDSIGLNLQTGVFITGKFEVKTDSETAKPWENANIEAGDRIIAIDNIKVTSIENLRSTLKTINKEEVILTLKREDQVLSETFKICTNRENQKSLGLYLKDNVLGVGTLTYMDIANQTYGALGHSAIDSNVREGTITKSYINGIKKGMRGSPGEKQATINSKVLGTVLLNNEFGVFGKLTGNNIINKNSDTKYDLIPVANSSEVKLGKANITTVLNGEQKETFTIEIIKVQDQKSEDIKGIKFIVEDEDLISRTGGIIQGMSGSPIVQNGMLIGAVSHVLVEDSKVGYGVFAEWMLNYS